LKNYHRTAQSHVMASKSRGQDCISAHTPQPRSFVFIPDLG